MGAELDRRYGEDVKVVYRKADEPSVRAEFASVVDEIETRGLLYPVTVIDGMPLYDGAVSYPAIMRAVGNKLMERTEAQA